MQLISQPVASPGSLNCRIPPPLPVSDRDHDAESETPSVLLRALDIESRGASF